MPASSLPNPRHRRHHCSFAQHALWHLLAVTLCIIRTPGGGETCRQTAVFGNLHVEFSLLNPLLLSAHLMAPRRYQWPNALQKQAAGRLGPLTWLFGILVRPSNLLCLLVILIVANKTTKAARSHGMLLPQHFSVFPQWEATCQSKLNSKPHSPSDSELTARDSSKVKQDIFFTA